MKNAPTYTLPYPEYLDKVFGCWLGKCVSGTIGAPYEGMKQQLDFKYDPVFLDTLIPNDDLDLQVLWLDVLERKGIHFTSTDLAEAFSKKCPYAPGEYAVFKKNFRRGIAPPLCGAFNNQYYLEGMGSPIRSEIWACIAPGNPDLAAELAKKDGVLDHAGNSVAAECFFAAMESQAFVEKDLDRLVACGLKQVPENLRIRQLICDVVDWCKEERSWPYVRSRILREYGHPSCTNLFENIGFTLLALYAGKGDLIDTTMIALNCGFDTDCSCATAGALLGIIHGAEKLKQKHQLTDFGYILEVDVQRRSGSIFDLAEDTCAMGILFNQELNSAVKISGAPTTAAPAEHLPPEVVFQVHYPQDHPGIGLGESKTLTLTLHNQRNIPLQGTISLNIQAGWKAQLSVNELRIEAGSQARVDLQVRVPADLPVLAEQNIFHLEFHSGNQNFHHRFGLVGAAVWQVFGPFWEISQTIPPLDYKENYMDHIQGENENNRIDRLHRYHNNNRIDLNKAYLSPEQLAAGIPERDNEDVRYEGKIVQLCEDRFSLSGLFGFQGPCVLYMERKLLSPEDRNACIQIGHTDAFTLWINGKKVAEKDHADWSTSGNVNLLDFPIRKGENHIVWKLARHSAQADFSLIIRETNPWRDHYHDFASKNLFLPDS